MSDIRELIKWANTKHQHRDYLPQSAVRHNRRSLVKAILYLRSGPVSKWVKDNPMGRKCAD
jgi:hypothetical protein